MTTGATLDGSYAARSFVRLFDIEPGLLRDTPRQEHEQLRQAVSVETIGLLRGPWYRPPRMKEPTFGYLIIDGYLHRDTSVARRPWVELLGPGDLIRPWRESSEAMVGAVTEWGALTDVRLAILDAPASRLLQGIVGVVPNLLQRFETRMGHLLAQAALTTMTGASSRLLILLWQLGSRWGYRDDNDDLIIPIPLTHEFLGALACVRRQTTTTALGALKNAGRISARKGHQWALHGDPPDLADLAIVQGKEAEILLQSRRAEP